MAERRSYRGMPIQDRRRDRRRRFCDSAIELFGTRGYAATSVAAVCRHAALSSRQFYEEFADREDLLRAVYDEAEDTASTAVRDAVSAALSSATDIDSVLDAGLRAFVDHFGTDPRLTRICFIEVVGVSPEFERHRVARRTRWRDLLSDVSAAGVLGGLLAADTDRLLWTGFIGAVNAVMLEQAASAEFTVADTLQALRTLLRRGVLG